MRYGSLARKMFKVRWGLHGNGLVEDHHIIPKQFKKHPVVVKAKYDINASKNLIMLPTRLGKFVLRVREDRLIHAGKHAGYNRILLLCVTLLYSCSYAHAYSTILYSELI